MNTFVKSLLLGFALALTAGVQADTKIGYVSSEQIMTKAAPFARAQKQLEKEFEKRKNELMAMSNKLRDMKTALEKGDVTMSESERQQRERDWNKLSGEFQRKGREFSEDLNLRQGEERKAIQDRTLQIIRQIAEAEKFDLIVQDALYSSPAIDLTDKVIKALADKPDGKADK